MKEAEIIESDLPDKDRILHIFKSGKQNLLSSFFKTVISLKKQKREFTIVLRGEGDQIERAVFEFNKFCEGHHPCYSGRSGTPTVKFDGSKNTKYAIITEKSLACFYKLEERNAIVLGTLKDEYQGEVMSFTDLESCYHDDDNPNTAKPF